MPYRSESSAPTTVSEKIIRNTVVYNANFLTGRGRSQYGYRSGPLTDLERESIQSNRANQSIIIDQLEDETGTGVYSKSNRTFMVHDRDYTETLYDPGRFGYVTRIIPNIGSPSDYDVKSKIGITTVSLAGLPALPSASSLEGEAAAMMRGTAVSLRPKFNVVRAVAELKDAKRMFSAASVNLKAINSVRKGSVMTAGQYLNYVFGVRPTANDAATAASSILALEPVLRSITQYGTVRQRRTSSRMLSETALSGEVTTRSGNLTWSANPGPFQFRAPWACPDPTSGSKGQVVEAVFGWYAKERSYLRQFGMWEFFIPVPEQFSSRLDNYVANAKRLLGESKLDESTVYELTPWTWLVDWFFDIGGLLRYQNAVNDNRIVATANGFTVSREVNMGVTYVGQRYNPAGILGPYQMQPLFFQAGSGTAVYRETHRRSGSPYSIKPTWDLTNQQWAILGALGLARGVGNPVKG